MSKDPKRAVAGTVRSETGMPRTHAFVDVRMYTTLVPSCKTEDDQHMHISLASIRQVSGT